MNPRASLEEVEADFVSVEGEDKCGVLVLIYFYAKFLA